jgi:cardiolipin synthase A/B
MIIAALAGGLLAVAMLLLAMNLAAGEKRIEQKLRHRWGVDDPQFAREIGILLGPPIVAGNRVTNLENGEEIFPAMLAAIHGARDTITFETYIYWSGEVGRRFAEALAERARHGVAVHVLIDWVGSQRMEASLLETMEAGGVQVQRYHPLRWYQLGRLNNRTHRKLMVIDGRIGFTGGVGIADQWDGHSQDPDHWRDSHYRLEGPAVAQMQAAFMDNWIKTTGEVLQGPGYFPPLRAEGDTPAQVFVSSPTGGSESMMLMYLMSIAAAKRTIDLSAAYFVPDSLTRRALRDALKRGVRLRIIVPGGHIDTHVVRRASRSRWGELLEAGAEIREFQPTMFHCKMLVVDGLMVSVGSTNFDNRSFRLNDEANLNVYDAGFAARVGEVFERDLARSRGITHQGWAARPWREKLLEHAASILSPQL